MADIKAIDCCVNNAQLIANAHALGYIEGDVLDLTYGEGAFWTIYQPKRLVKNDKFKTKDVHYGCDFRNTIIDSVSFDTVVFDPPYKLAGTPDSGDMDEAYGTEVARTRSEIHSLIVGGLAEAARITRKWLLVKCQDQVSSGQVRWQTDLCTDVARVLELRKVDHLLLEGGRPQPAGRRQVHARRNYSSLLVFKRGRR